MWCWQNKPFDVACLQDLSIACFKEQATIFKLIWAFEKVGVSDQDSQIKLFQKPIFLLQGS
jgi:hypothetical protein